MGALRWTGKGLKLVGQLLEAKEVEAWVENKGRALLEEKLQQLSLKWFAGRYRAKRQISAALSSSVQSAAFRSALEMSLQKLPYLLLAFAEYFQKNGPEQLASKHPAIDAVVVCPRGLLRMAYTESVLRELSGAAELARYESLPELFLTRVARQSEESFFASCAAGDQPVLPDGKSLVLRVDDNFGWGIEGINGHYYVGISWLGADLSEKRRRKAFVDGLGPRLEGVTAALGRMSKTEIDRVKATVLSK